MSQFESLRKLLTEHIETCRGFLQKCLSQFQKMQFLDFFLTPLHKKIFTHTQRIARSYFKIGSVCRRQNTHTEFFLANKSFAALKSYFSRDAIQNWGNGFRLLKLLDTYFSNFPILSCNIVQKVKWVTELKNRDKCIYYYAC